MYPEPANLVQRGWTLEEEHARKYGWAPHYYASKHPTDATFHRAGHKIYARTIECARAGMRELTDNSLTATRYSLVADLESKSVLLVGQQPFMVAHPDKNQRYPVPITPEDLLNFHNKANKLPPVVDANYPTAVAKLKARGYSMNPADAEKYGWTIFEYASFRQDGTCQRHGAPLAAKDLEHARKAIAWENANPVGGIPLTYKLLCDVA